MAYIDCYLAPVPRANKAAYERMAAISAQVVKEHGAIRATECWLDESGPDASTYHGDDVRLDAGAYSDQPPVFDGELLVAGGFHPIPI